jgi:UDP-glucose 4-epimerase
MSSLVIWVTGAHGFIGRHVGKTFADAGQTVVGLGHGAWPLTEVRKWGVSHWLNGDVASSNLAAMRSITGPPDVVVHLAGGSSVGSAIAQPREDFNRSVVSTAELFEWLRQASPETKVVAVSTAAVYGGNYRGMISEDAALKPYSPYGYNKMMMESICESYASTYGLRSIVARLFSVYGPGLRKQLLWDLCSKLHNDASSAQLGGTGDELRDFVIVNDVAEVLSRLWSLAATDVPKYNVGTGVGTTVREIAQCVINAWHGNIGGTTRLMFDGVARPGDPFSLIASTKGLSQLGLACDVTILDGIRRYVAWFKQVHAR